MIIMISFKYPLEFRKELNYKISEKFFTDLPTFYRLENNYRFFTDLPTYRLKKSSFFFQGEKIKVKYKDFKCDL